MRRQFHVILTCTLILACLALADRVAQAQETGLDTKSVIEKVRSYRELHEIPIVREFVELLAIPNVASDTPNIRKNAEKISAMLRSRGIETRLLEVEGAPPVVYGELKVPGAARTVAVYIHYDGQPVVPEKWSSNPWEPVLRDAPPDQGGEIIAWEDLEGRFHPDWRIYARAAGDDKAPIIAWLSALDALKDAGIPLAVNVKFFLEGEEEAGSPHLEQILDKYKELLETDLLFICDGPVHQSRRMQLFFGARGIIGLELTVYGPTKALHSGHYGNWAPNPAARLANLLAGMRDDDGCILIKGFYDKVRPLSESEKQSLKTMIHPDEELRQSLGLAKSEAANALLAERIMMPALNFRGLSSGEVGEKAKNAIPTQASAALGFRLVPDLTPEIIRRLAESHIRSRGYHIVYEDPDMKTRLAHEKIAKLEWGRGYPPARTPMDLPICAEVISLIEEATAEALVVMPTLGGSVPLYLFEEKFKAPVIGLPMANHDNNQHAPDENLRLRNLWDAIEINAAILACLGRAPTPGHSEE